MLDCIKPEICIVQGSAIAGYVEETMVNIPCDAMSRLI